MNEKENQTTLLMDATSKNVKRKSKKNFTNRIYKNQIYDGSLNIPKINQRRENSGNLHQILSRNLFTPLKKIFIDLTKEKLIFFGVLNFYASHLVVHEMKLASCILQQRLFCTQQERCCASLMRTCQAYCFKTREFFMKVTRMLSD